jgi:hypothetical protein
MKHVTPTLQARTQVALHGPVCILCLLLLACVSSREVKQLVGGSESDLFNHGEHSPAAIQSHANPENFHPLASTTQVPTTSSSLAILATVCRRCQINRHHKFPVDNPFKVETPIPVSDPYPHPIKIPILVNMAPKYKEHGSCSRHSKNSCRDCYWWRGNLRD